MRWLLLGLLFAAPAQAQLKSIERPKLILTLVIDQFRADTLARHGERFLPARDGRGRLGGFRFLMEEAAYYPLAEHSQLQNMTCPGHAAVLSGTSSYRHGIALNEWIDADKGDLVYCVGDERYPVIGLEGKKRGVSPQHFIGTTLGDELKNTGHRSQVVGIALKDRSAVLLTGPRSDLALWFQEGAWRTSRYYRPDGKLPDWLQALNQKQAQSLPKTLSWTLGDEGTGRSLPDNRYVTKNSWVDALNSEFPHKVDASHPTATMLPWTNKATLEAAVAALDGMKLGQGPDTDLLAVSFSTHDSILHTFGAESREAEEITIDEDRTLSALLREVDARVGIENTVVVLTADHGGATNPEWLKANKVDAGRLDEDMLLASAEAELTQSFGKPASGQWMAASLDYNLYLNPSVLKAKKITREKAQDVLLKHFAEGAGRRPEILSVFASHHLEKGQVPLGPLLKEQLAQTYFKGRSGDIILLPKPNYLPPKVTSTHVSGYAYDRVVPLFLFGRQIQRGIYGQKALIMDIAPTLALLSGTTPPSGSEGRVLYEVLRKEHRTDGPKD